MKLLPAVATLVRKDLRLYFRDRTGMLLGFLLPIALVTVFGYVMTLAFGGGSGVPAVELVVADDDHSDSSRRFIAELRQMKTLAVRPAADASPLTGELARAKVVDGDAHHALIIGQGFGDQLLAGKPPSLTLVRDPGRELEEQMVQLGLMQAFMVTSQGRLWPQQLASSLQQLGMSPAAAQRVLGFGNGMQALISGFVSGKDAEARAPTAAGASAGTFDLGSMFTSMVPMTKVDVRPPSRPKQLTFTVAQSVAGMTVMMLMFGLMACSTTLLAERDHGTLRRLLASPMPRAAIPLGKFVFCFVIGLLQMLVLFVYSELIFRVGVFQSPVTLLLLAVTWAACATTFGMLVAVWARTQKQAEGLSTLLILVMAALGGCWFPVQIATVPLVAEVLMRCTLTWWAMSGFQGMLWQQHDWTHPSLLLSIGVQWAFAVGGGAAALWLFRRRYLRG